MGGSNVRYQKEMNLHILQSIGARAETSTVMATAQHIISAQNNSPIIGCVQNTLIVWYILTNSKKHKGVKNVEYREDYMVSLADVYDTYTMGGISLERLFGKGGVCERAYPYYPEYISKDDNGYRFKKGDIPGKLFVSVVFPSDLRYKLNTKENDDYPNVMIWNGILIPSSGPLSKKSIGISGTSLVQTLWKYYSPTDAQTFISELQIMASYYVQHMAVSLGISDCIPTSRELMDLRLAESKIECEIIQNSNKDDDDKEIAINSILNKVMSIAPIMSKTSMNKGEDNALIILKKCGAKGNDSNNGSISWCIGQVNVDGKRVPFSLQGNTRALPHYLPGDISPEAKGFISSSYLQGVDVTEFWFNAYNGRRGVIDTAMKTSSTGYTQKRIVQRMADCKVESSMICDAGGNIIEFMYGGDTFNAKYLVPVRGMKIPWFADPSFIANRINLKNEQEDPILLTKDQIETMLRCLNIPEGNYARKCLAHFIRSVTKKLLKRVTLVPSKVDVFTEILIDAYETSKAEDGYMAGLVAACSIGEIGTQLTLNTFHAVNRSDKDITLGVPRLNELICATKKKSSKSSCTIYLDDEFRASLLGETEVDYYRNVADTGVRLVETYVNDFLADVKLMCMPKYSKLRYRSPVDLLSHAIYEEPWWVEFYSLSHPEMIDPDKWVLEVSLNIPKLYAYGMTTIDIANIIETADNSDFDLPFISCIPSPNNIGKVMVYVNFSGLKSGTETKSKLDAIMNDPNGLITSDNINYFLARNTIIPFIQNISIGGVPGITKSYVGESDSSEKELMIETQGSNFQQVLSLKGIDATRTITDHLWETYEVLGIEATVNFLCREITNVLSFDGTYINPRHVELLARSMCHTGMVKGATRIGISKDVGPIARGMFETSVDHFSKSSINTEVDTMKGIFSSVMMGTVAPAGTGLVDIIDVEM